MRLDNLSLSWVVSYLISTTASITGHMWQISITYSKSKQSALLKVIWRVQYHSQSSFISTQVAISTMSSSGIHCAHRQIVSSLNQDQISIMRFQTHGHQLMNSFRRSINIPQPSKVLAGDGSAIISRKVHCRIGGLPTKTWSKMWVQNFVHFSTSIFGSTLTTWTTRIWDHSISLRCGRL